MHAGLLTLVLAPFPVAGSLVVDARQEVEVIQRHLLLLDAQLVVQLPLCRSFDALDRIRQCGARLAGHTEGMRAARIGPHVGEGDLLYGTLLEKETVGVFGVEEEDAEGAVEEARANVGHQVAWSFCWLAKGTGKVTVIWGWS